MIGSPSLNATRNGWSQRGQHLPGGAVRLGRRVVRARSAPASASPAGRPCRPRPGTARRTPPGPSSAIGVRAAGRDQPADVERARRVSTARAELPPDRRASSTSPVGRPVFAATTRGEPVGVLGDQAQPDQPAPVLADQRHVAQVEHVEAPARAPTRRAGRSVWSAGRGRLVRAAEADQVGRDGPQARARRAPAITWR